MGGIPGFSWSDPKDDQNFRAHHVRLRFGVLVFNDPYLVERPAKTMHGELRFMAIGKVEGRVLSCVWTFEGVTRHLISLRPSSRKERRSYGAQVDSRRDRS